MITGMEAARRLGAVAVYIDGELFRTVPVEIARREALACGTELSPDALERLAGEVDRAAALDAAFHYLSYRSRSRMELERHLRRRGHDAEHIDAVVERCRELGYIDDGAFALEFARDRIRLRPRGRMLLMAELARLGVDRGIAEEAVCEAFEREGVDEPRLVAALAEKRWKALRGQDFRTARRRLTAYLERRGFNREEVRIAVDALIDRECEEGS